jgi:alpha-L-fucosidase 2
MKKLSFALLVVFTSLFFAGCERKSERNSDNLKLWYKQPAGVWEEALPVGNGRIGAMVSGDPVHERLQLNEESIWAGSRINNNNPKALKTLPLLQKAIFESRYSDALKLADENLLGTPPNIRSYQPLGDLLIDYEWEGTPENYSRELNLVTGIASTSFTVAGKKVKQEIFASSPDNIIVIRISSHDGLPLTASFKMQREKDAVTAVKGTNTIQLTGQIIDEDDPKSGPGGAHMKFAGELRVSSRSGLITSHDDILKVSDAKEITVRLTAATDYNINLLDFDRSLDPAGICSSILDKTEGVPSFGRVSENVQPDQPVLRCRLSGGQTNR